MIHARVRGLRGLVGPGVGQAVIAVGAAAAAAVLYAASDALIILVAVVAVLSGLVLIARPDWAMIVGVFLLYINAPAVAVQHGVPRAAAGMLILLLFIPVLHRAIVLQERLRVDAVLALMLAFLGAMSVSSLKAVDRGVALERIVVFGTEGLLLYWLIINCVTSLPWLRRLVWTMIAAGAFLASLTVYQGATRSYDQQFGGFAKRNLEFESKRERALAAGVQEERMYRSDRADGPLIGANRYAQILLVLIPLAGLAARSAPRPGRRAVALASGALILAALGMTYSRGGLLSLAVMAWCAPYFGWLRRRHVVAACLAAVMLLPVAAPSLARRMASLGAVTALSDPTTDGSLRGRATEMLAALFVFADHPFIGVGPGQYAPFYSVEYQQIPEIRFRDIQKTRRAHSLYIEMAADVGAVGLLLFVAIPAVLARSLLRAFVRHRGVRPDLADLAAALLLSFAGFFTIATILSHAFERYYWLLIGVAGAAVHIIRLHESRETWPDAAATGHGPGLRVPAGPRRAAEPGSTWTA